MFPWAVHQFHPSGSKIQGLDAGHLCHLTRSYLCRNGPVPFRGQPDHSPVNHGGGGGILKPRIMGSMEMTEDRDTTIFEAHHHVFLPKKNILWIIQIHFDMIIILWLPSSMSKIRTYTELPILDVDVSENSGTPKSSILIGFSIINHPFWGTPIFGNTHVSSTQLSPNTRAMSSQRSSQMGKPSDASTRNHEDTYRGIRGFARGFSNICIYILYVVYMYYIYMYIYIYIFSLWIGILFH